MKHRCWLAIVGLVGMALPAVAAEVNVKHRRFTVPEGFTVELAAAPPLVDRPITADFDEAGNLYVADSSGSSENPKKQLEKKPHRIMKLTAGKKGGAFEAGTVFADQMMFPEGTMWREGSLYVAAPPSIWKLTDTKGTGVADERVEWFTGKTLTGCANDLHGPYAGPDGWIYWCKGAFAEQTYERAGGRPFVTRAAHLFRARADGTGIEPVMTGGMDNPVEIAFTPGGERIFTCTFLTNPANGKRDGIIHAVYGGIYGKIHDVIDDHPHTFPEVMPVLVNTGPAAECALMRYEGSGFGAEYADNLLASSFNLHKVTRHVLTADGATFKTVDSDFLTCDSLDFHPTHLVEDADGSVLVVDTGGWYKLCCPTSQIGKPDVLGAIYRVRKVNAPRVEDPRGLKLAWEKLSAVELCRLLDDGRPAVRRRAIAALGQKGGEALAAISKLAGVSALGRLNVLWAATRIEGPEARAVCRSFLRDGDAAVRQAAAHSASVWRDREAVPALLELLAAESAQNRRVAAEALGRLGDGRAVGPLLEALEKPVDHVLEHSLVYALIEIADGKGTQVGLESPNPHVRRGAMMALDQMTPRGGPGVEVVARELGASDAALRESAGWIAARHPEWGDGLAAAMRERLAGATLSEGESAQVEHQIAKLAKSGAIQKLVRELLDAPGPRRRMALAAMGEAGLKPMPAIWAEGITAILEGKDAGAIDAVAGAIGRLPADARGAFAQALLAAAANGDLPADTRLEALEAVPKGQKQISAELFTFVIGQMSAEPPEGRRTLAAASLRQAKLSEEQLAQLLPCIRTAGPLAINDLLGLYEQSADEAIGLRLIDALREAKAFKSLRADQIKPRLAKYGPKVRESAEGLLARLNPDAGEQKARLDSLLATLPMGDIRRGQAVFNSAKVACVTCHAIGYVGGHVGPDLTRVGGIRAERDLLESIAYPSASFAQSYEPYTAITTGGERFDGVLRRNDAEEVMLVTGPDKEAHIPRAELKELRPGTLSIMPSGLDQQLSPQELADLVAFLKGCK